ncbi:RecQ family ATP-dependent DNA helicase [Anaerobacillus isosaccharinicus]|uniref:ATP-dependent DNA helicase RecQ n=1 Tax=Anaerobacillus isosaccharinicus TaxID=1532552 RepID=A0A1S2M3U0_9BACI|nr:ATP-dependent DNA helicase RecQ [Anaerobacillus isosaccharinicus]MBA5585804.1 ATP-dependent DNA helicase RecQ [Anaerobacillus isosaccharinicus]QOY35899.1 ATP-dependent DNA helicase RecQ [Anaerobacillus isosaccharinicus]
MDVHNALYDFFKLTFFRTGQREIINDLLNGQDVLAMLPTGAGKSLCYQLPAFMLTGITVVVSPLLSLMEDQVQQLKSKGLKRVVALNSFLSNEEREIAFQQLSSQKIIYVSPEILQSKFVMKKLKSLTISLFVVDEAHCISQWGHEFRTDYFKLSEARQQLGNPPCLAITATATKEVQRDIVEKLSLTNVQTHIYSIDRPNIAMIVKQGSDTIEEKLTELVSLVKSLQGPGIIYASTRKWTEDIARILQNKGIKHVSAYHGGMSNEDRLLIQQQFINDELQLICCTSAFGMGVNKQNIRYVIHFHFPMQLESYLQEIGRAGRDGEKSIAITFYSEEEKGLQLSLLTREFPSDQQVREVLMFIRSKANLGQINELNLMAETGITEIMWRFIRFHLEEQGVIVDLSYHRLNDKAVDVFKVISEKITSRIQYKQRKLTLFQEWLKETRSCRRETVLDQFNESLTVRPDNCCDVCGIKLESYFATEGFYQEYFFQSWQKELKRIFHN